jgi:ArsR family transcriptional regulator, arsenate/arsenite/antimonite-responsive transcriptional repressor
MTDHATPDPCCSGGTTRLSPDEAESLARQLAAVADPTRLHMLSIIASSSGEVCACDFVGPVDKSQPTVSHHLKVLSEAGLIEGDKRGRWIWYRLSRDRLDAVMSTLAAATA